MHPVAGGTDRIDFDGLGNVLAAPPANSLEAIGAVLVGASHHRRAHVYAARLGHGLEPRGDVDAVAEHIPVFFDHVAEIETDAQLERARRETVLNRDSRVEGLVHAW